MSKKIKQPTMADLLVKCFLFIEGDSSMLKKVYVVLKNADFTEGRGPMIFNSVWDNFEAAEKFVMSQYGIYGSKQGKERNFGDPNYQNYNGYDIITTELFHDYDPQERIEAEKRVKELAAELKTAEENLRRFK